MILAERDTYGHEYRDPISKTFHLSTSCGPRRLNIYLCIARRQTYHSQIFQALMPSLNLRKILVSSLKYVQTHLEGKIK